MPNGASAEAFFEALPFRPDQFQRDAVAAFVGGASVVVTAPTGAGKTLVAEAAVHVTLEAGRRAFYTAPIKALSNQKFLDFRAVYGDDGVGLLTGDNVVNGDAPLVVMTTEVLRNMIYADSAALDNLGVVILDEVHYLQDRYRGSVWEEIIIHLPAGIPLVNLSATIANAEEFTAWIRSRRGHTELIVEDHRPVPLESLYLVKDRHREGGSVVLPIFGAGNRPNPQLDRMLRKGRGRRRRFVAPRRLETVELLDHDGLLPAIYFIFSRAGCDQAAELVAGSALGLTDAAEREEIRRRAEERTTHVPPADLAVLGYPSWLGRLEQGVAAHHAGLIPAFKEVIEELFAAGLIKVVFATETLALGINMPARTVVLERLSKFTGDAHEIMQPGDYTQLTGRAGRRGIDVAGTAVVLHQQDIPFGRIAAIAGEGSHALRSSFQPTYNMAVNLVANYEQTRAEELLAASFAQFRATERRSQLEARVAEREEEIAQFRAAAACDCGDLWVYLAAHGGGPLEHTVAMRAFAQTLDTGDVLRLGEDDQSRWVVLARGWGTNPRLLLLSASGDTRRVLGEDLHPAPVLVGSLQLPEPVRSRDKGYLREVAKQLRSWHGDDAFAARGVGVSEGADPVASCPKLAEHLDWVRRAERAEQDRKRLLRRLDRDDAELVKQFHTILALLEGWGYTEGWAVTDAGERLRFIYNELDLLLAETVGRGLLDDLSAPDLAAVVSLFTFEARLRDVGGEWPNRVVADRGNEIFELWERLTGAERRARLPESRPPDEGFTETAHAWTAGHDLDEIFDGEAAAGDFVRNCRQLLDLLRQLRDAFPSLRPAAARAIKAIDRGVVAVGGRS
jgi:ATP-dependent RNA helicase HelY